MSKTGVTKRQQETKFLNKQYDANIIDDDDGNDDDDDNDDNNDEFCVV